VSRPSRRTMSRPVPRPHALSQNVAAAATSTPPTSSVPIPPVAMAAGLGGAISAPTGIPAVAPGASCIAVIVKATFSQPMARSFMGNACQSSASCTSSGAWPKAWASGVRRACSRSTPIRCCSGWSRPQISSKAFPATSCMTCGSSRCSWTNSSPCSARSRTGRSARLRLSSALNVLLWSKN